MSGIEGIALIRPRLFGDARGWFSETWRDVDLTIHALPRPFIQENQAFSVQPGTLRGLHLQRAPHAQAKLVMVVAGAIRDVVVDVRRGSATFGRHQTFDLAASEPAWIYVPAGCLHGYVTLEAATRVLYRVDAPYVPQAERTVRWDDPALGIDWGVSAEAIRLSDKDAAAASLATLINELEHNA